MDSSHRPQLVILVTIVNRGYTDALTPMLSSMGAHFNFLFLGKGTANSKLLDYLGLGETEKDVLFSAMPQGVSRAVMAKISDKVGIERPGRGISFTVPIGGVCGLKTVEYLKGGTSVETGQGEKCKNHVYDLILAITNNGHYEGVMDAAKSAGATGGTVLHARGVGAREAEKFLGISIQAEKEVVMILAKHDSARDIMQAVAAKAGLSTPARTMVFSLPVGDVIGLSEVIDLNDLPGGEDLSKIVK